MTEAAATPAPSSRSPLLWAILGSIAVAALVAFFMYLNASNSEIGLRNQIGAVQKDNANVYDNMWKKIAQAAQIPEEKKNAIKDIFIGYADARSGEGGKAFVNAVHEAVPTVDMSVFDNLMNIITSSRDRWASNQTRLIDLQRAHMDVLTKAPSSWFVGGRQPIEIKIITSTRTDATFEAGKDDDITVFPKK